MELKFEKRFAVPLKRLPETTDNIDRLIIKELEGGRIVAQTKGKRPSKEYKFTPSGSEIIPKIGGSGIVISNAIRLKVATAVVVGKKFQSTLAPIEKDLHSRINKSMSDLIKIIEKSKRTNARRRPRKEPS